MTHRIANALRRLADWFEPQTKQPYDGILEGIARDIDGPYYTPRAELRTSEYSGSVEGTHLAMKYFGGLSPWRIPTRRVTRDAIR